MANNVPSTFRGRPGDPGYEEWRQALMPAVPGSPIAESVNRFMTQQAVAPYQANIPNYQNMVNQRSNVTGQMLQGQVPTDVVNQILQQAAERGISAGGGPNMNAAFLRGVGQTSLGLQQQGIQNLGQTIEQTPVPELWNPMSLYVPSILAGQEQQYAQAGQQAATAQANRRALEKRNQEAAEAWRKNSITTRDSRMTPRF